MTEYIENGLKNNSFKIYKTSIISPYSSANIELYEDIINGVSYECHPYTGSYIREISNDQYDEMKNYIGTNYKWLYENPTFYK